MAKIGGAKEIKAEEDVVMPSSLPSFRVRSAGVPVDDVPVSERLLLGVSSSAHLQPAAMASV